MPYSDYVLMCDEHLLPHYSHKKCVGCIIDNLEGLVRELIFKIERLERENK